MSLNIIPKGNFLYCQLDAVAEKQSKGGVILPDVHSERTRFARVLAKGDSVSKDIEIGSVWAVDWFAGTSLHLVGYGFLDDTHRLISESELMARIEEIEDEKDTT